CCFRLWSLYSIAIALIFPTSIRSQDTPGLRDVFERNAMRDWEEYRAFCERLVGSAICVRKAGEKTLFQTRYEFKSNNECKLCTYQSLLPEDQEGQIRAYNRQYAFTLERRKDGGSWTVRSAERHSDGSISQQVVDGLNFTQPRSLLRAYSDELSDL